MVSMLLATASTVFVAISYKKLDKKSKSSMLSTFLKFKSESVDDALAHDVDKKTLSMENDEHMLPNQFVQVSQSDKSESNDIDKSLIFGINDDKFKNMKVTQIENLMMCSQESNVNSYSIINICFRLLVNGAVNDALKICDSAISIKPNDAVFYYGRSQIYRELKSFDLALENIQKAIKLNKYEPLYRYSCVVTFLAKGDEESANKLSRHAKNLIMQDNLCYVRDEDATRHNLFKHLILTYEVEAKQLDMMTIDMITLSWCRYQDQMNRFDLSSLFNCNLLVDLSSLYMFYRLFWMNMLNQFKYGIKIPSDKIPELLLSEINGYNDFNPLGYKEDISLAEICLAKREYRTAQTILKNAAKKYPNEGEIYYYIFVTLKMQNNPDKARNYLESARKLGYQSNEEIPSWLNNEKSIEQCIN